LIENEYAIHPGRKFPGKYKPNSRKSILFISPFLKFIAVNLIYKLFVGLIEGETIYEKHFF